MKTFCLYAISPLALIALWGFISALGIFPTFLLPTPHQVLTAFGELLANGELIRHIATSALRALTGFAIAASVAMSLAYLCATFTQLQKASHLILEAFRVVPPLSLVPLLILWLGIDEAPKIAIVFLASFFPIYLNAYSSFKGVNRQYIETADSLDLTAKEKFRYVILPASLPGILTGLRLGFGYSWRALVGAELIAAASGLGFLISESSEFVRTDRVFVGIVTIAFLGILADLLFVKLIRSLTPWASRRS